jgi:hypothetical protein
MNDLPDLLPGDVLIYTGRSFFDWVIRLKRGSFACHTEIYIGGGQSVAARNWPQKVNRYPVRWKGLYRVYRPNQTVDIDAAMKWFYSKAQGKSYDILGLLCFTFAAWQSSPDKFFCSEFARDFLVPGGFDPYNPDFDSDHCAPDHYETSANCTTFWKEP